MGTLKKKILCYFGLALFALSGVGALTSLTSDSIAETKDSNAIRLYVNTNEYKTRLESEKNVLSNQYEKGQIDEKTYKEKIDSLEKSSHTKDMIADSSNETAKAFLKEGDVYHCVASLSMLGAVIVGPIGMYLVGKSEESKKSDNQTPDKDEAKIEEKPLDLENPEQTFEQTNYAKYGEGRNL